jgi:hypothetical protein
MGPLDLDFVRSQFPAFSEPSLAGFAHFENAGGSFASRQTIEALQRGEKPKPGPQTARQTSAPIGGPTTLTSNAGAE